MKKVLIALVGVVLLALACVLVMASMQPDTLTVSESITVKASPADMTVYAHDFERWNEWSPWADIDPDNQTTYSDPPSGVGATYEWKGNKDVGSGKMTIKVADAGKAVHTIEFFEPFPGKADSTITWAAEGDGVKVTWGFSQEADFGTKMASMFMDIEGMLSKDYQKGLNKLKPLLEGAAMSRVEAEKAAAAAAEAAAAAAAAAVEGADEAAPQ